MPKMKATGLPRRRSIGNNTQGPKRSPGERKLPSSEERPLLLAKLRVQHIPAALPRPALFRNLDAARRRGQLVWIGAGAGKTTLMMSYLAARGMCGIRWTSATGTQPRSSIICVRPPRVSAP